MSAISYSPSDMNVDVLNRIFSKHKKTLEKKEHTKMVEYQNKMDQL